MVITYLDNILAGLAVISPVFGVSAVVYAHKAKFLLKAVKQARDVIEFSSKPNKMIVAELGSDETTQELFYVLSGLDRQVEGLTNIDTLHKEK